VAAGNFLDGYAYEDKLLSLHEVVELIDSSVAHGKPYSLSRFGHAEISEMAYDTEPGLAEDMEYYRKYNGVTASPDRMQRELVEAFRLATTAGLLIRSEDRSGAEYTRKTFARLGLEFGTICSAFVTHQMVKLPFFWDWVRQYRIALVGRRAQEAASVFGRRGVEVTSAATLPNYDGLPAAYEALAQDDDWQIALISAGVPATLLAPRIARATSRVAIDFGHALDLLVDGPAFDFEAKVKELSGE